MIGISQIRLRRENNEQLQSFAKEKKIVKKRIEELASATKFEIWEDGEKLCVMLLRPISLQTVDKIMHTLQENRISIRSFSWEVYKEGPIRRGKMEIIVS